MQQKLRDLEIVQTSSAISRLARNFRILRMCKFLDCMENYHVILPLISNDDNLHSTALNTSIPQHWSLLCYSTNQIQYWQPFFHILINTECNQCCRVDGGWLARQDCSLEYVDLQSVVLLDPAEGTNSRMPMSSCATCWTRCTQSWPRALSLAPPLTEPARSPPLSLRSLVECYRAM